MIQINRDVCVLFVAEVNHEVDWKMWKCDIVWSGKNHFSWCLDEVVRFRLELWIAGLDLDRSTALVLLPVALHWRSVHRRRRKPSSWSVMLLLLGSSTTWAPAATSTCVSSPRATWTTSGPMTRPTRRVSGKSRLSAAHQACFSDARHLNSRQLRCVTSHRTVADCRSAWGWNERQPCLAAWCRRTLFEGLRLSYELDPEPVCVSSSWPCLVAVLLKGMASLKACSCEYTRVWSDRLLLTSSAVLTWLWPHMPPVHVCVQWCSSVRLTWIWTQLCFVLAEPVTTDTKEEPRPCWARWWTLLTWSC